MADLNPLKFQVAIQDDATQKLNDIESKLNSLKDQQITVSVHGIEDLRSLLNVLQHKMVDNLGNNVSQGVSDALRSMQTEAQSAIRQSLSDLASNLATIKGAIQNDNFTAFGKRIGNCAEEVNRLNEAFEKFHITIGKDDGLKNFMTGLGEVIRNVRQTMGQLHGNDPGYNVSPDALSRSINVAKHETERLNSRLTETQRTIETFSDKGFNTARLERYKSLLIDVRDNLTMIEKNGGVHPLSGLTALQYLRSEDASRITSLLNNELTYYKRIGNELESIAKLKGEINTLLSTSSVSAATKKDLSYVLSGLDLREGLFGRLGVRDAFQSINTDAYREQIQQVVGVISRANSEIRQGVKDSKASQTENEKWAKSVDVAKQKIVDLEMKIASLKATKDRGDLLHLDTSSLTAYIAKMENLLTIMRSIEAGMKIHGTAESFASSASYRNTWKLADAEEKTVNKNADAKEKAALATQRLNDVERQLAQSLKSTTQEMRGQSQMLSDLKMLATQYLGVWGAQGFLNNIIKIGGQLESQRLSLTAILGQRSYANDLFEKVQDLALKSPFGVVQLDQYTKNLSAFGFQYNELFDMTKRLADIAAGTGTDFGRLALALGHVRSEMALTGYTLRQFSMANVPMLKMLAENLGVTTAEIRKMVREKKVSYEDVEKVLKDLTDEGGMFYNMQEVMSEAVSAKFKNLKDAMDIMYGQMAESVLGDMLKGIAATLTDVTKRWQTFGTVLLTTASIIGAYKLYMHLLNVGIRTNTINLLQNTVATKTLTAADVEQMLKKKLLTAQDIALALAEGNLTLEQAKGALIAAGYTEAIVAEIAATKGLSAAMKGLKASSAGMFAMLTNPWTAALLTVEAVIGSVMAYKTWSDNIQDDVNRVLERAKTASQEIGKYLREADKEGKPDKERDLSTEIEQMKTILENSELYTEELQEQIGLAPSLSAEYDVLIKKMKEANANLEKMGVDADAIAGAIKASSTGDMEADSWFRGFWMGTPSRMLFNDDINQNTGDLEKSLGQYQRIVSTLDQYQSAMEDAMRTMIDFYGHSELVNLPLSEQIRLLAKDEESWTQFVNLVDGGSGKFVDVAKTLKDAADDVNDDWNEIVSDDVPRMMEKMAALFGKTPDQFREWAKTHNTIFQNMLDTMISAVKVASPKIAAALKNAIRGWLDGVSDINLEETVETEAEKEARLRREALIKRNNTIKGYGNIGKHAMRTLVDYAKAHDKGDKNGNGLFDINFVGDYFKKDASTNEGLEAIDKDYKKYKGLIAAAKKSGNKAEEAKYERRFEQLDVAMDAFGLDKTKGDKKQKQGEKDKDAKELRERVRILKEAADSFQYWREKVGDTSAETHVNEEFGKLLSEQGFKFENIEKFRETLAELRKEYEKKPKSKAMLEALKELDRQFAQLDRKDFEKGSEEFMSKMQVQLENITRSWETFNSVRDLTGDVNLAVRLSGVDGDYKNVADALKAKLTQEFKDLKVGVGMVFDANLSDREIEQEVFKAVPRDSEESVEEYEKRIKSLVELYKKWANLQKDVEKSDKEVYARLISSVTSFGQKVKNINDEYAKQREAIKRQEELYVATGGREGISKDEGKKADSLAQTRRDLSLMELRPDIQNFYNSIQTLNRKVALSIADELASAYRKAFEQGFISADEFDEKMKRVNEGLNSTRTWESNRSIYERVGGLFFNPRSENNQAELSAAATTVRGQIEQESSKGEKADKDLIEVLRRLEQALNNVIFGAGGMSERKSVAKYGTAVSNWSDLTPEQKKKTSTTAQKEKKDKGDTSDISSFKKFTDSFEKGLQKTLDKLGEFQKGLEFASSFFESLGMKDEANAAADAAGILGGAMNGASALSSLGPYGMAAGAGLGLISGIAQVHDNQLAREIEALRLDVQKIESNTALILANRERTFGYDRGQLRTSYAQKDYSNQEYITLFGKKVYLDDASYDMFNYYMDNTNGNGYQQQYANLKKEREDQLQILRDQEDMKDRSESDIQETIAKISELDEQIRYFGIDLAKELWDIDVKGWADQIGDALMTAFENGEDAAKAYEDTIRSIMQSVSSNILKIGILEPMMERLNNKLFGYIDAEGKEHAGVVTTEDITSNPEKAAERLILATNEYFAKEGKAMITAAREFYVGLNDALEKGGLTGGLYNQETGNTLSSSMQGTTEETSDLMAAYLNAARQDLSVNRLLLTQFISEMWPSYIEQISSAVSSLNGINNNVAFIRELLSENGALYVILDSMRSHLDNITNGNEQISVK